jgi:hypothetical protein
MAQTNFTAADMPGASVSTPAPAPKKIVAPAPKAKKPEAPAPVIEEAPVAEAEAPAEETE